jgi:porin
MTSHKASTRRFLPAWIVVSLPLALAQADGETGSGKTRVTPPAVEQRTSGSGASMHEIESSNYDATFSPGEATTSPEAELDEIYGPNKGLLDSLGVRRIEDALFQPLEWLDEKTGLRIGAANTMLFMQPIGGQSSRYGASGDFDLMASWTLLGRGTEDTGRFVFTGEFRYKMGIQPPSALRGEMGTLVAPTGAFNDRGWVIRDLFWVQRLFDGKFRILIGRADPSDYVGSHWLQSTKSSFLNRNFSANVAIPFPGHGPLVGISLRPTDQFYLTLGACNAYSTTIRDELDTLFKEFDIFSFGEVGYTPTFNGLGAGRYAFGMWYMDEQQKFDLPSDYGLTFIADQNLTENLQVFARYSYSDGTLTNIRHAAQIGFGISGVLGRTDDLTGIAFGFAIPRSDSSRDETALEIFHRIQVARTTQLSVGMQLIANPGNALEDETAGVFYARLRTAF